MRLSQRRRGRRSLRKGYDGCSLGNTGLGKRSSVRGNHCGQKSRHQRRIWINPRHFVEPALRFKRTGSRIRDQPKMSQIVERWSHSRILAGAGHPLQEVILKVARGPQSDCSLLSSMKETVRESAKLVQCVCNRGCPCAPREMGARTAQSPSKIGELG